MKMIKWVYSIIKPGQTHRKWLSSLLDYKALNDMGEDLRFDHCMGDRCSVPVPMAASGKRQGQRESGRGLKAVRSRCCWWEKRKKTELKQFLFYTNWCHTHNECANFLYLNPLSGQETEKERTLSWLQTQNIQLTFHMAHHNRIFSLESWWLALSNVVR